MNWIRLARACASLIRTSRPPSAAIIFYNVVQSGLWTTSPSSGHFIAKRDVAARRLFVAKIWHDNTVREKRQRHGWYLI